MHILKSLSARAKLILSFLVVCVMLGSVAGFALTRIGTTFATIQNMYDNQLLPISALGKACEVQTEVGRVTCNALLSKSEKERQECLDEIQSLVKEFHSQYNEVVIPQATTPEEKALTVKIVEYFPKYVELGLTAIDQSSKGDTEVSLATLKSMQMLGREVESLFDQETSMNEKFAEEGIAASKSSYTSTFWLVMSTIVAGTLIGQGIGWWIARWFTVALLEVSSIADSVAAASQQLAAASEEMSNGAQEQASGLEETASSLEEITSTIQQNSDNAQQANQLAGNSRRVAESGGQVVEESVKGMNEIFSASKRIADIITTIDEIAFQTNLLALNAAVEAARAGEQGRGFAVVAGEVRNLAQRSAGAAKEIKSLIQDSVGKVQTGSTLVNKSGESLHEIVTSVKRVSDIISEIAAASREQATGIDQVNRAISQMDQVVQTNAAQTEELTSTAENLAGQAIQLQELVGQFNLVSKPSVSSFRSSKSSYRSQPVALKSKKTVSKGRPAVRSYNDELEGNVEQQLEQLCVGSSSNAGFSEF